MFAELLAHPGVVERAALGSRFGIMAFHGGSLERHTDVIALAAAQIAGASSYVVQLPEELRWHIPSKLVDPAASPALAGFLDHVDTVVAVHGYGRRGHWTRLLAGGSNRPLASSIADALHRRLDDYEVVHDLDAIPVELRGLHPDNPVNRCRGGGVQLELPPRIRGSGPYWQRTDWEPQRRAGHEVTPHTAALVDALVEVASSDR